MLVALFNGRKTIVYPGQQLNGLMLLITINHKDISTQWQPLTYNLKAGEQLPTPLL